MARMTRSYSSRALAIDRRVCISVLRGDSWPSRSWTVSSGRPAFRASVAQGAAWLSGSHHAAERDGYPKPVVAPTGHPVENNDLLGWHAERLLPRSRGFRAG